MSILTWSLSSYGPVQRASNACLWPARPLEITPGGVHGVTWICCCCSVGVHGNDAAALLAYMVSHGYAAAALLAYMETMLLLCCCVLLLLLLLCC